MKLGFIGLGKMGSRMAEKLLKDGHDVIVWNRSKEPIKELKSKLDSGVIPLSGTPQNDVILASERSERVQNQNLKVAKTIQELVESLEKPRVVWSMLPAGEATETTLLEVSNYVESGDIVIDGGNAHFKDTEERYKEFRNKEIKFLGIGVSGGIVAVKEGYPMMVGGDKSAYEEIKPILDSLSKPKGGYEYFGEGGAGHFVKMVHNAIEYGIMQSLGEGFDVLSNSPYPFDLKKVAKLYQRNSLVSGFMLDRVVEVLDDDPKLEKIDGVIGSATGETDWTIDQAKEENIPVEIIERSLEYRKRSQTDPKIQNSITAKLVSGMRKAFGGHDATKK